MACGSAIGDLPLLSDPLTSPFHGRQRDHSLSSHNPSHYLHLTFIRPEKGARMYDKMRLHAVERSFV